MTYREAIQNIKNIISSGTTSDDFDISDRQIAFWLDQYRSTLIKQKVQKRQGISDTYKSDLGELQLVEADVNELCDIESCILRTKIKIPTPIYFLDEFISYVGVVGGEYAYQKTFYERLRWDQHSRFTSKEPKWFLKNGYVYLVLDEKDYTEYINIVGVFERPYEFFEKYKKVCEEDDSKCLHPLDQIYPLNLQDYNVVVKMIFDSEIKMSYSLPEDEINNTQDDTDQ